MRMVSIASGSSGNCIYIGSDNTHLLVDAGISNKRIQEGLNDIGPDRFMTVFFQYLPQGDRIGFL